MIRFQMKIELAPLPYEYTALEPKIGKRVSHANNIAGECKLAFFQVLTLQAPDAGDSP